jgi:hypothetical protein
MSINNIKMSAGRRLNIQGHLRDVLIARGYDVTYRETGGSHNNLHFRATFADALLTLLAPK